MAGLISLSDGNHAAALLGIICQQPRVFGLDKRSPHIEREVAAEYSALASGDHVNTVTADAGDGLFFDKDDCCVLHTATLQSDPIGECDPLFFNVKPRTWLTQVNSGGQA